jgi:hypothetical protein
MNKLSYAIHFTLSIERIIDFGLFPSTEFTRATQLSYNSIRLSTITFPLGVKYFDLRTAYISNLVTISVIFVNKFFSATSEPLEHPHSNGLFS